MGSDLQAPDTSAASEASTPPQRRSFAARLVGALRLDASVFEEVEHDAGALHQAAAVVLLGGIGRAAETFPDQGLSAAIASVPIAFVMWLAVTAAVAAIGVRILRCTSSFDELLRTLGFAAAPLLLLVVCILPLGIIGTGISLVVHAAAIGALVLAVRQALDVDTLRALMVCVGAVGLGLAVLFVLGVLLLGKPAA